MKKLLFLLLGLAVVLVSCGDRALERHLDRRVATLKYSDSLGSLESSISYDMLRKTDEQIAQLKSAFEHPPVTIIGDQAYIINDFTYKGTKYRSFERLGIENNGSFTIVEVHDK